MSCSTVKQPCPQLPGTVLRVFIPAGTVVNLLNLIELSSPAGICLILRIPLFGGLPSGLLSGNSLVEAIDSIKKAGGTVEVVK